MVPNAPGVIQTPVHHLQVYRRHQWEHHPPLSEPPHPSTNPSSSSIQDYITLRKGKQSSTTYHIFNFVSYDCLHLSFRQSALFILFESTPKNYEEAILVSQWKEAMDMEMQTLLSRSTSSWN